MERSAITATIAVACALALLVYALSTRNGLAVMMGSLLILYSSGWMMDRWKAADAARAAQALEQQRLTGERGTDRMMLNFINNKGAPLALPGSVTLAELVKRGCTGVRLCPPGTPLQDGWWELQALTTGCKCGHTSDTGRAALHKGLCVVCEFRENAPPDEKVPVAPVWPKVYARFNPQAWVNGHAIDADPEGESLFDVTPEITAMGTAAALRLKDNDYGTDNLRNAAGAPAWIRDWQGPFWVEVHDAVHEYVNERDTEPVPDMQAAQVTVTEGL
jgi:hypothetical protein